MSYFPNSDKKAADLDSDETILFSEASTLTQLKDMACMELRKCKTKGSRVVMIVGPIDEGGFNDVGHNMAFFQFAGHVASRKGLKIFDQWDFQDNITRIVPKKSPEYYANFIAPFYSEIFRTGYISSVLLLQDWDPIVETLWEVQLAKKLKIPVETFPNHWLAVCPRQG